MSSGCRLALASMLVAALTACPGPDRGEDDPQPDAGTDAGETNDGGGTDAGETDGGGPTEDGGTDAGDPKDECGFEFKYDLGFPCNSDADCESGVCFQDFSLSFCTTACEAGDDSPCPEGFSCDAWGSASMPYICAPTDGETTLPGDNSLAAGSPCNTNADCADEGSICLYLQNPDYTRYTFCGPPCESSDDCGECGSCEELSNGDGACIPKGSGTTGDECASHHDCDSFFCIGFCTGVCGGEADTKCPNAADICQPVNDEVSICISERQNGQTPEGAACRFDFECATGNKCLKPTSGGSTQTVCTPPLEAGETCRSSAECASGLSCVPDASGGDDTCQPPADVGGACAEAAHCVTGLGCRDISSDLALCTKGCEDGCGTGNTCVALDLDTEIRLFDSPTATRTDYVVRNDDIDYAGGNAWSRIVEFEVQPGRYFVAVETFRNYVGAYKLEILAGAAQPTEFFDAETPVRNDKIADAQDLPAFPATVLGTIDSDKDVDYFGFTVPGTQPVKLTIRTGPGAPSACLPDTLLATQQVGDACTFNQACASGLCEGRLDVCGKACASDGECGGAGFKCVELNDHKTCVSAATVGAKERTATCQFSYECADGYCGLWEGKRFCTPRCESPTDTCPATTECADLTVTRNGATVTERACVPEGDKTGEFNAACALQSDCKAGLVCDGGKCAKLCATDSECPAQKFPPSGVPAPTCKPCETSSDCGSGNSCMQGVGLESFCVAPCGANDACPPDFTCRSSFSGDFCVPAHGSCRKAECAIPQGATSGVCVVPESAFAELCDSGADCTTQTCSGGLCSTTCDPAAANPCGCATGDVICSQGQCVRAPYTAEVEGSSRNDSRATAQPITGNLPFTVYGELRPVVSATGSQSADKDWFSLTLTAGKRYDIVSRPLCGTAALALDTAVTLYDATGAEVDSDSFFDNYGAISDATVTTTGQYFILVEDDAFFDVQTGAYILEVKEHVP